MYRCIIIKNNIREVVMDCSVIIKTYDKIPFNTIEVMRYCGCKTADERISRLIDECIEEINGKLKFSACYRVFPLSISGDECNFDLWKVTSHSLASHLTGCDKAVVFSATVGIEIDRLIQKYSYVSPAKSLVFQAIGSERIESLCDRLCDDVRKELHYQCSSRFSPGYGDLSLETQNVIFSLLQCTRNIGVTLNNSLLMSPTKSVTAILGLKCAHLEV